MTIKVEMDGPLAIATFSDPPMHLLTAEFLADFEAAMEKALDAKARAFLTLAEGDNFCGGANISQNFLGKNANDARRLLNQGVSFVQRFERLPIPTVCAIRGLCLVVAVNSRKCMTLFLWANQPALVRSKP
jgi:enoyl-CoA hydratase/carnithine racemase